MSTYQDIDAYNYRSWKKDQKKRHTCISIYVDTATHIPAHVITIRQFSGSSAPWQVHGIFDTGSWLVRTPSTEVSSWPFPRTFTCCPRLFRKES